MARHEFFSDDLEDWSHDRVQVFMRTGTRNCICSQCAGPGSLAGSSFRCRCLSQFGPAHGPGESDSPGIDDFIHALAH
jgi:hypothetical protein